MKRAIQISRILTLAAWAGFFGWLVSSGQSQLGRLLHPSLWWLVVCAAIVLALFLMVNLRRQIHISTTGHFWLQWPGLLILLIPLLYFIPAQRGRLNADTLEKRAFQTESGFVPPTIAAESPAGANDYPPPLADKEEPSDIPLTRLIMNPEVYQGQEVEVMCRTFIDSRLPDTLFMCYRYLITCCAADAMPVFIYIQYPEAGTIEKDAWIKAKGQFSQLVRGDKKVPAITVDSVQYIDEPPFPYLF